MPGVKRYEDLEAWQIADELKREVYALTATGRASKDFEFLKDGVDRGHFTPTRVARAQELAERSIKCSTKFIVYLKSCKKNWQPKRRE
jgi:hypothetical protein